jgi:hypothetical protein
LEKIYRDKSRQSVYKCECRRVERQKTRRANRQRERQKYKNPAIDNE